MRRLPTLVALFLFSLAATARADNEGQADLDKATELQIAAETLGEMEQVIKLAESALAKGLDKEQTEFAKKLLGATLYQHADRAAKSVVGQGQINRRFDVIRRQVLKDLDRAKQYDAGLPDVYLLEAKFQTPGLPGSDAKAGAAALAEAIRLLK